MCLRHTAASTSKIKKSFAMRIMFKWFQPDTDEPKMTELPAWNFSQNVAMNG